MSYQYDMYIQEHKANVASAFRWIEKNLPDILKPELGGVYEYNICYEHDESKYSIEEYKAYDDYFYGDKSHEVVEKFNRAWLHHIHANPHHWQHWILFEDDPTSGEKYKALDMPDPYILEMICDWWSFSFRAGDLHEIFRWYDERKDRIVFSKATRKRVEYILDRIREKLDEQEGNVIIILDEDAASDASKPDNEAAVKLEVEVES